MIITPTSDLKRSIKMLESNQHFQAVRSWISDSLRATRKNNDTTESETKLRWGQGSAQDLAQLEQFLNAAGDSPERREGNRDA